MKERSSAGTCKPRQRREDIDLIAKADNNVAPPGRRPCDDARMSQGADEQGCYERREVRED
jgi:hypothetical protein